MKMSVGTRIVLSLFLIVIIAVCGLIIAATFGAFSADDIWALTAGFTETAYKYIWAAAAMLIALVAVCLLFFRSKKDAPANAVMLETSEEGTVALTVDAIKELVNTYLKNISGLTVQRIEVLPVDFKKVRLNLAVAIRAEIPMHELVKQISDEVKVYVDTYAGVAAEQVNIKVMPQKSTQAPAK